MDHKNGNCNDNRLDNLRLLCPNCHSQTDTYAGRNVRYKLITNCIYCNNKLKASNREMCSDCYKSRRKEYQGNFEFKDEYIEQAKKIGIKAAAKIIGISHTTLRRYLLARGITVPKRNQWGIMD